MSPEQLTKLNEACAAVAVEGRQAMVPKVVEGLRLRAAIMRAAAARPLRGAQAGRHDLERLDKALFGFLKTIEALGPEANRALAEEGQGDLTELLVAMQKLNVATLKAHVNLSPENDKPAKKGRPPKAFERGFTPHCARAFKLLADREPTRVTRDGTATGPFHQFLTAVFDALEIDASPESQAKLASGKNTRPRTI